MTGLTAVSLFAGIGGFDLALERGGVRVAAAVEIDPACRGVLRRHFPQTTVLNDVTEVTGGQLRAAGFDPRHGILAGGWPCQGNSRSGLRKGMDDPRSGLWRHNVRLLGETRPRWFIGENVPNLLAVNNGRDFHAVLSDLDELGYGVAWRVLDASRFGLAQRRERLYLVGCLGDGAAPAEVLLEPDSGEGSPAAGGATRAGDPGRGAGGARGHRRGGEPVTVVSTLQGGGRRGHRIDAEGAAGGQLVPVDDAGTAAVRRLTPLEWERLQGFPDDWTRRGADGREQADSVRYRQAGNAVPVPVAAWLARRVAWADNAYGTREPARAGEAA